MAIGYHAMSRLDLFLYVYYTCAYAGMHINYVVYACMHVHHTPLSQQ